LPQASQSIFPAAALAPSPANLFTGTSGWAYPSWKPGFYPLDVPARRFLQFYASRLNSVEVNFTFRKLPTPAQLQSWLDATPPGFRFSFKAPQRITHFQRLRECHDTLTEFLAAIRPARAAGKLGLLLFQLPPNFKADPKRLDDFLKLRPFRGRSKFAPLQIAFEFRHETCFSEETYTVLRRHNAALCIAESDTLATPDIRTATFACYRLRRNGGYSRAQLKAFAERFTTLAQQCETYAYFKHEDEPTGALNATSMLQTAASLTASPEPR
jgi:uncharacterized protein YecE (DUF72 family)